MSYEAPTVDAYGTVESRTNQISEKPGFSVPVDYF